MIIRQCVAERRPYPKRIREAPNLEIGLGFFFEAFMELHTCRGGMGCDGPIPWTAVDAYARRHRLNDEQADDLLYYVRAVDDAWSENQRKKQESEKRRGKAVRKPGK